jgi:uncharacterized protein (DUF885 family)
MFKVSLLAVALTLGAHAAHAQASVTPEDRRFEAMVRAADKQDLAADPTRRTVQTLTPSEAQWTPVSDAWRAAKTKVAAQRLAALPKAIDRKTLSPDHQILFDLYAANLKDAGITQKALLNGYTSGANIFDAAWDLPQTLERSQKLRNVQDARNYLARLNGLPQVLDDTLAAGETRRARDIVLTKAGYKALAIQVREFAKGAPCAGAGEHALAHDFKAKLAASTVAQADRPGLIAAADAALKDRVCPAYAKFADAVEAMAPSGRDGGMWERVGGAERYRDFVEFHLADRVDPEVLYDTGVKAVAELETELRTEAGKLGLHGDIAAIRKALDEDPKLSVPNTPEGYSQIEAITNARLADVEKRLPAWFSYIPKTPVVVQRALKGPLGGPPSAGSYFGAAAPDGSRPAVYNLAFPPGPARIPAWSEATATYHEAVPGHAFQDNYTNELRGGPDLVPRRFLVGYADGWAMYTEQLAGEMGVYDNDPYGRLGMIMGQIDRAVRLVLDTGLNAKGWSAEQATAYQKEHLGGGSIGRFLNWPGQAVGYYWGYAEILRLRERAKAELGPKFDIRGFHDAIIRPGMMPADVMRKSVDNWIAKVKAGA